MCVLTGLREEQYDQIMRWFFQASVSDCSIPRLCRLLLCTLPRLTQYSNHHCSYHTSSSAHLGVPCLRPSISLCHTRSFAHLGVYCLRPRIMNTQPALPLPSSSYCLPIYPLILLLLALCEYARLAQSCFYDDSWSHQASFLFPPPSYHVSLLHASNRKHSATH